MNVLTSALFGWWIVAAASAFLAIGAAAGWWLARRSEAGYERLGAARRLFIFGLASIPLVLGGAAVVAFTGALVLRLLVSIITAA